MAAAWLILVAMNNPQARAAASLGNFFPRGLFRISLKLPHNLLLALHDHPHMVTRSLMPATNPL
ncbi:hypothetical protein [Novosphingobium sp. 9U]|uniref:hypothetical protein n=1 Tax=Novosphingobium sp. 9U TaxID=2653158 RepID=UPI0012F2AEC1|nr:hypothetical protein [Novosphingobium sp. 9U]VWX51246.1 hypothetical protein NOVOSPHI9U_40031 [Novosphingobium sp. 9U]